MFDWFFTTKAQVIALIISLIVLIASISVLLSVSDKYAESVVEGLSYSLFTSLLLRNS